MYVVTGAAGFIGSNIVAGLNERGIKNIIVVDAFPGIRDVDNLATLEITDYLHHETFLENLTNGKYRKLTAIIHQGACSDTMETNEEYVMRVNFEYSKSVFQYCADNQVPFIYASSAAVYGDSMVFTEDKENEKALNLYARSKLLFDNHVRMHLSGLKSQVIGLRYFNVYGPREQNKGRMASVAYHFYNQIIENGNVKLFEGSNGYAAGEQLRDFIWVGDVVDTNMFLLEHGNISGIFNVGTGRARSFNDLAAIIINKVNDSNLSVPELVDAGFIQYVSFPKALEDKYQSFTQADVSALRDAGYSDESTSLEQGLDSYIRWRNGQ